MAVLSRPGFFSSGVTRPCFNVDVKTPTLKDLLTRLVMTEAMTSAHDFISEMDMKYSVDVFAGSALIIHDTSSTVTSERAIIIVGDFLQVGYR